MVCRKPSGICSFPSLRTRSMAVPSAVVSCGLRRMNWRSGSSRAFSISSRSPSTRLTESMNTSNSSRQQKGVLMTLCSAIAKDRVANDLSPPDSPFIAPREGWRLPCWEAVAGGSTSSSRVCASRSTLRLPLKSRRLQNSVNLWRRWRSVSLRMVSSLARRNSRPCSSRATTLFTPVSSSRACSSCRASCRTCAWMSAKVTPTSVWHCMMRCWVSSFSWCRARGSITSFSA
mmetsp:Transcript_21173/g.63723  ORF Transcript_21173/g.63723 Transcript_21173/m.63723 type:complete len:231 (-) Transcript_21173:1566-2258(-)